MIIVVARNMREAEHYLQHRDPPVNPRSRGVIMVSTFDKYYDRRLRGYRFLEDDEVIFYGACYEGDYYLDVLSALQFVAVGSPVEVDDISKWVS